MAVQQPILGSTTIAGLLGIVGNNAQQQLADEAALTALQNQVTNILARSSSAPGSYSPPGAAGAQSYSAKSTAWTSAASQGNVLTTTGGNAAIGPSYMDVWDPSNLVDLVVGFSATNTLLTFYRVQRYTNRAPSIIASATLSGPTSSVTLVSAVISSAKVARLTFFATSNATQYEVLLTWNGTALSVTSANTTSGVDLLAPLSSNTRRGFLVGTASWIVFSLTYTGGTAAGLLRDRNSTLVSQISQASHSLLSTDNIPTTANYVAADVVGSGYHLRGGSFLSPADPTVRPALFLEYYDDYSSTRVATLRVTNTNFGGWIWLVMVSPTLAIGQYRDATVSGTYYTVGVSVNVGQASPLGLYGPFTNGVLGSGILQAPALFDGTDAYFFDTTTMSTASPWTIKMRHLIFNPANTGSEITTAAANDITVTLGANGAGTGGSGATLTAVTFLGAIQQADQIQVFYSGTTGTAATNGLYVETFNLS